MLYVLDTNIANPKLYTLNPKSLNCPKPWDNSSALCLSLAANSLRQLRPTRSRPSSCSPLVLTRPNPKMPIQKGHRARRTDTGVSRVTGSSNRVEVESRNSCITSAQALMSPHLPQWGKCGEWGQRGASGASGANVGQMWGKSGAEVGQKWCKWGTSGASGAPGASGQVGHIVFRFQTKQSKWAKRGQCQNTVRGCRLACARLACLAFADLW